MLSPFTMSTRIILAHRAVMKADADCQLDAGHRRQVGHPPLHGDGGLAGVIGVVEESP
jgi:hypothetical protein